MTPANKQLFPNKQSNNYLNLNFLKRLAYQHISGVILVFSNANIAVPKRQTREKSKVDTGRNGDGDTKQGRTGGVKVKQPLELLKGTLMSF